MRILATLFALGLVVLGANQAFGLSLTLLGAGPTGEVYMTASPLGAYNGDNFYAGVLDWKKSSEAGSTPDYFTYCVDIASVIFINGSYSFNQETVGTLSSNLPATFPTAVMNGIENLWDQNLTGFQDTLHTLTSTDKYALETNTEAAELQIALWDIIYNGSSGTLLSGESKSSPLYFSNPNIPGSVDAAMTLANNAYKVGHAPSDNAPGLTALQATDGSQNQIYLGATPTTGGTGVTLAPAPNSLLAFLMLLGSVGVYRVALSRPERAR
jgi:hypothetical protein